MKLATSEADKFASMEMGDEYFGSGGKALREYNIRLAKDLATSIKEEKDNDLKTAKTIVNKRIDVINSMTKIFMSGGAVGKPFADAYDSNVI